MTIERSQRMLVAALEAHLSGERLQLPEGTMLVWNYFCQLSDTRTIHGAGANPISFHEIAAFSSLLPSPLRPRDVAAIRALDAAFLKHSNRERRGESVPGQALNPAIFDAMFR